MKEGVASLGKMRGFTYLLFFLFCIMLLHDQIADALGAEHRQILFAFVLLTFMQVTTCVMHLAKFAMAARENKTGQKMMPHVARLRMALFGQYGALLIIVLNEVLEGNRYIDIGGILFCIVMIYFILKDLTILQRARY